MKYALDKLGAPCPADDVRASFIGPPLRGTFAATLKPKVYADRIVRRLGLEPYFSGVYRPELEGRFDDKADLLAHLLATEKVSPERAVSGRSECSGATDRNPSSPTPGRMGCARHPGS
jgi:hypothetical protein